VANPAPFEIKRHYRQMSEKDTDTVVQAVVELIVSFLTTYCGSCRSDPPPDTSSGGNPHARPFPGRANRKES